MATKIKKQKATKIEDLGVQITIDDLFKIIDEQRTDYDNTIEDIEIVEVSSIEDCDNDILQDPIVNLSEDYTKWDINGCINLAIAIFETWKKDTIKAKRRLIKYPNDAEAIEAIEDFIDFANSEYFHALTLGSIDTEAVLEQFRSW